jgi:hypothetical protein
MRFHFQHLLCTAALSTIVLAFPQQAAPAKTLEQLAPFIKAASITEAKPLVRPTAKRQLVRYGPWDLPGVLVNRRRLLSLLTRANCF